MYVTRTRVPAGCRQTPGPRSFDRVGTVLSGTLYVALGEQAPVAVAEGRTWTIPARTPCVLWAKEGDVLLQVMGN